MESIGVEDRCCREDGVSRDGILRLPGRWYPWDGRYLFDAAGKPCVREDRIIGTEDRGYKEDGIDYGCCREAGINRMEDRVTWKRESVGREIDATGKLESAGWKISDGKMETIVCLHLAAVKLTSLG